MDSREAELILSHPLRFGNQRQIEAVKFCAAVEELLAKAEASPIVQEASEICWRCRGRGTDLENGGACYECVDGKIKIPDHRDWKQFEKLYPRDVWMEAQRRYYLAHRAEFRL